MISLTREKLLELLKTAFDEGWSGYKDLKDSIVEKIVVDFEKQKKDCSEAQERRGSTLSHMKPPNLSSNRRFLEEYSENYADPSTVLQEDSCPVPGRRLNIPPLVISESPQGSVHRAIPPALSQEHL